MKWRKWNYVLHRDIGYLCVGLTLIYAISGIAVNHISNSFNPSYNIDKVSASGPPLPAGSKADMAYIRSVLQSVEEEGLYKNAAFISPETMRIFVEGNTIDIQVDTGQMTMEKVRRKPVLFEVNYLHLNKGKGVWTWLADIYGLALFLLAVTGMLMIKGKQKRRGIILTATGFLVPLIYLLSVL
jgi:hypothetical protein